MDNTLISPPPAVPHRPLPDYNPPTAPLAILYQDDDVLIIDKPSGLLSVTGKQPGMDDTLESRSLTIHSGAQIVHRLDWDTSGIMVLALTPHARRHLGAQFELRKIEKHYVARVWGVPSAQSGTLNLPMRGDWPNRPRQIIDPDQGREAVTHWEIQTRHDGFADLSMKPKTGRTHQLRVHCQSMGHPILGDRLYAHEAAYNAHPRMCLHASFIAFDHPVTVKRLSFSCPPAF